MKVPILPIPDSAEAAAPQRTCIATGLVLAPEKLVRFVLGPDGSPVPDLARRLPGRGFWLLARPSVLQDRALGKLFARAARRPVALGADFGDRLVARMVERAVQLLGLARRSGNAIAGFERVRAYLASGRAALLIEALDASETGRRKIGAPPGFPVASGLHLAELGRAFGLEIAAHAAIGAGALAGRIEAELARLTTARQE
jgi:uncharacterized protein